MATVANSVDPDETAPDEPSHLDPHCLPFCYRFFTETPVCNNGCVQIQRRKSPFQKLRAERVNLYGVIRCVARVLPGVQSAERGAGAVRGFPLPLKQV